MSAWKDDRILSFLRKQEEALQISGHLPMSDRRDRQCQRHVLGGGDVIYPLVDCALKLVLALRLPWKRERRRVGEFT